MVARALLYKFPSVIVVECAANPDGVHPAVYGAHRGGQSSLAGGAVAVARISVHGGVRQPSEVGRVVRQDGVGVVIVHFQQTGGGQRRAADFVAPEGTCARVLRRDCWKVFTGGYLATHNTCQTGTSPYIGDGEAPFAALPLLAGTGEDRGVGMVIDGFGPFTAGHLLPRQTVSAVIVIEIGIAGDDTLVLCPGASVELHGVARRRWKYSPQISVVVIHVMCVDKVSFQQPTCQHGVAVGIVEDNVPPPVLVGCPDGRQTSVGIIAAAPDGHAAPVAVCLVMPDGQILAVRAVQQPFRHGCPSRVVPGLAGAQPADGGLYRTFLILRQNVGPPVTVTA